MPLNTAVGTFAKSTAAAPASQAVTGLGFTPKVLILFTAGTPTVVDTPAPGIREAIGFTTRRLGEVQSHSISWGSSDGNSASNSSHRQAVKALTVVGQDEVLLAECDLVSFDADGFTLNWITNGGGAFLIGYLALGGTDITDARVLGWDMSNTTGDQAVSGLGFNPGTDSVALHLRSAGSITVPFSSAHAVGMLGAMRSTSEQWVTAITTADAAPALTAHTFRAQLTDACFASISAAGAIVGRGAFKSWDADGFTINWSVSASARRCATLVIKGGNHKLGSFAKATGAAPASQSINAGFAAAGLLMASFQQTASAAVSPNARLGLGAATTTSESSMALSDSDGTGAVTDVNAVHVIGKAFRKAENFGATADAEANATLTATGFDLSWSPNDAVATNILYWTFGGLTTPVGASLQAKWNVASSVSKTLSGQWKVSALVARALAASWNTRTIANRTLAAQWRVAAAVGRNLSGVWNVRSATFRALQAVWAVRAATGASLEARWSVAQTAGKTLEARWAVLVPVGVSTSALWQVYGSVGRTLDARWNVFAPVGRSLEAQWDVLVLAGRSLDAKWIVFVPVGSSLEARWNVESQGVPVGVSLESRWNVRSLAGVSVDARWNVAAIVNTSLEARWNDLILVGTSAEVRWNVQATAGTDLSARWNMLQAIGRNLEARWSVLNAFGIILVTTWNVREVVGRSLDARWDVFTLVTPTGEVVIVTDIVGHVVHESVLRHRVVETVAGSPIEERVVTSL